MTNGPSRAFADPALADVWSTVARRLERGGLVPAGRVTVTGLTRDARLALSGLLGRSVVGHRVVLGLAELDTVARDRLGVRGGLVAACEQALDRTLVDRPAQREHDRRARGEPVELLRKIVATWPGDADWAGGWVAEVARIGLASRASDPLLAVTQATEIVAMLALPRPAETEAAARPRHSRTELAAHCCGNAHALDDGSVVAALVLRGLAHRAAQPMPDTSRGRRELWASFGVEADLVSTTALTLGLRAADTGSLARRLRLAADDGDPVHLTARNVTQLADASVAASPVLVCENPRVLELAADLRGGDATMVCTMGRPATVVIDLLKLLAAAGCALHYHGDFDWPGLAITAQVVTATGARPWRMGADHYLAAVAASRGQLALDGTPTPSPWDPALSDAMRCQGLAVHEEALLPGLVLDWPV